MHFSVNDVNEAFYTLVDGIHQGRISTHVQSSRNGEVMVVEEPVIITYRYPKNRVLLNPYRDANPFFNIVESLWMLAGRNDVEPLAYYNSRMSQFSDDGKTFNGAYGYRWRHPNTTNGCDQLHVLIEHLRRNPESRRAVLQMWNVEDDLLKIDVSKDVACNLAVCFSVEQGRCRECNGTGKTYAGGWEEEICWKCKGEPHDYPCYLNMTVFNRSNDLILGMLGSNYCHFSFLQEYMATALDLDVGKYHQITNNMHVYLNNWKPNLWLRWYEENPRDFEETSTRAPLVEDPKRFDEEVKEFVSRHKQDAMAGRYREQFLNHVAQPLCIAFHHYKRKEFSHALASVSHVYDDDWRRAGIQWLTKRMDAHAERRRQKKSDQAGGKNDGSGDTQGISNVGA